MRRTIALALTILFGFAPIAPLFAPDADASLPACCRRNGKHHCSMRMTGQLTGNQKGFTAVSEKCPCGPIGACAVHSPTFQPPAAQRFYAETVFHPARAPQTEARRRIACLRSHQKRGPPTLLA